MRAVTIHVDERVYEEIRGMARGMERSASELIREAMVEYRDRHMRGGKPLWERDPAATVGEVGEGALERADWADDFWERA